jgi:hypothetical protein
MKYHQPKRFKNVARATTGLARNASATKRGYGYRWQQLSKQYRQAHPCCEVLHCYPCNTIAKKGQATTCPTCQQPLRPCGQPTRCTDHIRPVTGPDDPLFFAEHNWEACCWPCHSALTVKEDGGLGRTRKR